MTDIAEHDDYDEDDECPNCGGDGYVDSCFEDTCVCLNPPCCTMTCDWCDGEG